MTSQRALSTLFRTNFKAANSAAFLFARSLSVPHNNDRLRALRVPGAGVASSAVYAPFGVVWATGQRRVVMEHSAMGLFVDLKFFEIAVSTSGHAHAKRYS
jgi:hypothetical protein